MLRLVLLLCVGCSYSPGSYTYATKTFVGQRATVGCIDLAVDRRPDHEGAAVLAYRFGNRCDSRQMIDFSRVTVVGRDAEGHELQLVPFDPTSEIRPLPIDARLAGGEVLAYHAQKHLVQVCVDAASLARKTPERWLCFAQPAPIRDESGDAIAPSERVSQNEVAP